MTSADYVHSGKVLTTMGYCMDFKFRRLLKITASKLIAAVRAVLWMGRNRGSGHGRQRPKQSPRRVTSA